MAARLSRSIKGRPERRVDEDFRASLPREGKQTDRQQRDHDISPNPAFRPGAHGADADAGCHDEVELGVTENAVPEPLQQARKQPPSDQQRGKAGRLAPIVNGPNPPDHKCKRHPLQMSDLTEQVAQPVIPGCQQILDEDVAEDHRA